MERVLITNRSELLSRLTELRVDKDIHEVMFAHTFKEITNSLNILNLFKRKTLSEEPLEFARQGVTMAMDLIMYKIRGKKIGFKEIMSSVFAEKIIYYLIDNKFNNMTSFFTRFFNKK